MDIEEFRKHAHSMVDWMADYLQNVEDYPVLSNSKPGDIKAKLPLLFPENPEDFTAIFKDFEDKIMPGITHWESPNFLAYFPASKSKPSILGEMIMSVLGTQGMVWLTSPAATELEDRMMEWMRDLLGLSKDWTGSIQDTASTGTFNALITAREKASNFQINEKGFFRMPKYRVYASEQAHSSIDKNVKIAGFGYKNLVKIPVDEHFAMIPEKLEEKIQNDIDSGYEPLFVLGALGTTGTTAVDPLEKIGEIAKKYHIWFHVDAAYSGAALICPQHRWMSKGLELADSMVFNPHKWMFVNFDCSLYYVKEPDLLKQTYSITPEYLKTDADEEVNNYRDWHIQLGRRFRALKLWFVLREFGAEKLRSIIDHHIKWAQELESEIKQTDNFEMLAPVPVNLLCFRFNNGKMSEEGLNQFNEQLLKNVNATGKIFITHTKLNGKYSLRLVGGHAELTKGHLERAWGLIRETASALQRR
ncbi:pyridoxal-dependent decarboxylase [Marivirga harenae]|uniref:pyridoxal phosphate-dependent decarboxylase family protein n=1 Tax=Marivirga harenae TaxID=2010992 RepID=UPI0026E07226|nr:pyridoxal-dependent decarboxylase [Marivirga harenae]WKV13341.1 aminotransferase class I/II-fold pyridoxal phosphate-dependent enzyme [Marivirga harenae]|tara:strand:+ start:161841 stop:163262 length:1422 start_codon:yes stop_codon:yes gene_type:complete